MMEQLKGKPLTAEERLEIEEGSYIIGGDNFIEFTFPRRDDKLTALRASTFKRDGTDMYVVEQYNDGYRVNYRYIDKEEFDELTKDLDGSEEE